MKLARFKYIAVLALMAGFGSCSNDVESVFTESSANRIDAALADVQDLLIGPANGWLMEYYPGSAQLFGGFNVLMQFSFDGHVTVASESAKEGETATSTYTLKQSAGAVLSFDTYNSVFHYYSDPDAPGGGSAGYGMEGDFEFLIISVSPDEIVLKGKKSGSYARMTPMSVYYKWDEFLSEIKAKAKEVATYQRMQYTSGDNVYEIRQQRKDFSVYKIYNGEQRLERYPYIVTLMGCKFYNPIMFADGESVDGVVLNPDLGDEGGFMPTNDASGVFLPSYPSLSEYIESKNWFLCYDGLSQWAQSRWDVTRQAFGDGGEDMTYCYLGESLTILGTYWAFNFMNPTATGFVELQSQSLDSDRISISLGGVATKYANILLVDYKMSAMLEPMCIPGPRTFKLSSDDPKDPQWILCTDENDPSNWFKLYRAKVYDPLALK